jgi:hypothetical protein
VQPDSKQQLTDAIDGMLCDVLEHVPQISRGFDAIKLGAADHGVDRFGVLRSGVAPRKRKFFLLCMCFHNRKNWLFVESDDGGELPRRSIRCQVPQNSANSTRKDTYCACWSVFRSTPSRSPMNSCHGMSRRRARNFASPPDRLSLY